MENYLQRELNDVLKFLSSTIHKCEKMKLKFSENTSQYSLLTNRIKALRLSKDLIEDNTNTEQYTLADLENALPPVRSIRYKAEKAQSKYEEGTSQYNRYIGMIRAMQISDDFIENEISKRSK